MNAEQAEEQASLYVMGLLSPDEARAFEAEAAADPQVADLVTRLETGAAALAWTSPPLDPPAALRDRVKQRIRESEKKLASVLVPFPNMWAWVPWAAAACLAIIATGLAYDRYHLNILLTEFLWRDRLQQTELDHVQTLRLGLKNRLDQAVAQLDTDARQKAATQSELGTVYRELADLRARNALSQIKIATLASMLKNEPQAMAVVAWDPAAQRGILQPVNMPAAGADQDYQLWIIDPGYKTPVSAGVFDPAKRADFQPAQPISKADKFAISLEKKGGSETPQGPIVLVGE